VNVPNLVPYTIRLFGDPVLKQRAKDVTEIDGEGLGFIGPDEVEWAVIFSCIRRASAMLSAPPTPAPPVAITTPVGQAAPLFNHSRSVARSAGASFSPGGIAPDSTEARTADGFVFSKPDGVSSLTPPDCLIDPWQAVQFCSSTGCTSLRKSAALSMAAAPRISAAGFTEIL